MPTLQWSPGELIVPGDLRAPRTTPPTTVEQITNGDFEAGNTNWTYDDPLMGVVNNAAVAFDGTQFLYWQPTLYGTHFFSNDDVVEVVPGQVITCQLRYRRETNNSGRQGTAIGITWYDSGMTPISNDFTAENNTGATGIWYWVGGSFTAPANAAFAQLVVAGRNNNDGGTHGLMWDAISWDYIQPAAQEGLVYKAVQASPGTTDSVEPDWPIVLGATVVDNEVTWEAVLASSVTWEASPILKSGATEPTWPTEVGAQVLDNDKIAWEAISRMIEDEKCPHTKVVVLGAKKIFAADEDIIAYCATVNPLDWSTPDDAGYLPFGLQTYGANPVAAMSLYRSNLVAFNSQGFQMWQIDPDPANMAFLDAVPVGSTFPRATQPVANDLAFLNAVGVRNLAIAGASTNLQADGVGEPIDALVGPEILALANESDALGLFWPSAGQYWIVFGDEAFVLTINGAKKKSWSRYVFPEAITDWTLDGNDLLLRTETHKVWRMDESLVYDDVYYTGDASVLTATPGPGSVALSWTEADTTGAPAVDYYRLYVSVDGGAYSLLTTVNEGDPLEYDHTGLQAGEYSYYVDYIDVDDSTGPQSNIEVEDIAAPTPAVLLHFEGADEGTTLTDSSANNFTLTQQTNPVVTDTAQFKFGVSSGRGASSASVKILSGSLGNVADLGSSDFTMEAWVYSTAFRDRETYIMCSSGRYGFGVFRDGAAGPTALIFYHLATDPSTFFFLGHTATIPTNEWVHLAVAREGANLRFFVNGALVGTTDIGARVMSPFVEMEFLGFISEPTAAWWQGWVDEFRLVVGQAVYTAAFTPPAAPFPPP